MHAPVRQARFATARGSPAFAKLHRLRLHRLVKGGDRRAGFELPSVSPWPAREQAP